MQWTLQILARGEPVIHRRILKDETEERRTAAGAATTSCPATCAVPWDGRSRVHRILMVVDLQRRWSQKSKDLTEGTLNRNVIDRGQLAKTANQRWTSMAVLWQEWTLFCPYRGREGPDDKRAERK